jgi:hypothetical protein
VTEQLNFDGIDWTLVENSILKWSTAWLTCATIPDDAVTVSSQSIDFGDISKGNALFWERIPSGTSGAQELSCGYITAVPGDTSYADITLGSIPADADFLRIKVSSLTRTTSPTAPTPGNMMTGAIDPIPPMGKAFVAHDAFIPLEQANPIARAIEFINDGGTLKLRRIQSIGKDNLIDDCVLNWAPGNSTAIFDWVNGGIALNPGAFTYGAAKGQPIYYVGDKNSGSETGSTMTRTYDRGGANQMSLTDPTDFQSVYSLSAVIEPGYFKTDPVLGAPTSKSVLRAGYQYRAQPVSGGYSTLSYTGTAIGTPAASRHVLVMVFSGNAGTNSASFPASLANLTMTAKDASGTTVGTITASKLAGADALAWPSVSIWIAAVPDGVTVDLSGTYTESNATVADAVLIYSLYNFSSYSAVATCSGHQNGTEGSNLTASLSTASGGFAFVAANHLDGDESSGGAILGGVSAPGIHGIGGYFSTPYNFEGAVQPTTGTSLSLAMQFETNRHTALCGVSLA